MRLQSRLRRSALRKSIDFSVLFRCGNCKISTMPKSQYRHDCGRVGRRRHHDRRRRRHRPGTVGANSAERSREIERCARVDVEYGIVKRNRYKRLRVCVLVHVLFKLSMRFLTAQFRHDIGRGPERRTDGVLIAFQLFARLFRF